jgi:hypothetical protein
MEATYALTQISRSLDGAQAIVDARSPHHVSALLESSSAKVRKCGCMLVGRLAVHEPTAPAVLQLYPFRQLVNFLR